MGERYRCLGDTDTSVSYTHLTYVGFACNPAQKYFTYSCTTQTATAYTLNAAGKAAENMGSFQ